jgi:glycine/D-amino acid oxidase-like deaminating enzyme
MFDCVVIGGGIIGVNILRRLLLDEPKWQVALLDRSISGSGASYYSAGLHFPYGRTKAIRDLSAFSEIEYMRMNSKYNLPITPISFIGIVSSKNKQNEYCNYLRNPLVNKLHSINQLGLNINLNQDNNIFEMTGCHYANVNYLITQLVENIRHTSNAKIWEGVNVDHISYEKNILTIGLDEQRKIQTKRVIISPGPWINKKPFGEWIKFCGIKIKKVVAMHIDIIPQLADPVVFFHDEDAFLLPLHKKGQWLFSYTCQEWDVDPDDSCLSITSQDRADALAILEKYRPDWVSKCLSGRVFCDAYTVDRAPLVKAVTNLPNMIFAGAAGGSGYRLAPAIAHDAVKLLLENKI